MEQVWLSLIKAAALRVVGLKRYWKVICKFVSKVSLLEETREARRIENMTKYLEAVAKNLSSMKRNGVSDEAIRALAVELNVPLIQANLEAMVIARQFATAPPDSENAASAQDRASRAGDPAAGDATPPKTS